MRTFILALVALAALATGLSACGSPESPKTFAVAGTYQEAGGDPRFTECLSGSDDIAVTDAAGKKLVIGETSTDGTFEESSSILGVKVCSYTFKVSDIPRGEKVYSIQIADSKGKDFTQKDAADLTVTGEVGQ